MQNETKVCFDGSTSSEETERKYALGECDILKEKQEGSCLIQLEYTVKLTNSGTGHYCASHRLAFALVFWQNASPLLTPPPLLYHSLEVLEPPSLPSSLFVGLA